MVTFKGVLLIGSPSSSQLKAVFHHDLVRSVLSRGYTERCLDAERCLGPERYGGYTQRLVHQLDNICPAARP